MKIYEFSSEGNFGKHETVVVLAENVRKAKKMAIDHLAKEGRNPTSINVVRSETFDGEGVVYFAEADC